MVIRYKHLKLIPGKFECYAVSCSVLCLKIGGLYIHGSYGLNCKAGCYSLCQANDSFQAKKRFGWEVLC